MDILLKSFSALEHGLIGYIVPFVFVLTIVSAMLGHYLARTTSRWGKAATLVLLCGLMIPPQVILLPITQVLNTFHLMATIQGLVLFNVGYYVPFGVFVFAGFVRTVPIELEQAAAIDGAGWFSIFWRIVFPLLRPRQRHEFYPIVPPGSQK